MSRGKKILEDKRAWLDKLHGIDKQQGNLELNSMSKNGVKWNMWKKYFKVREDDKLLKEANNRTILPNEIMLDVEIEKKR